MDVRDVIKAAVEICAEHDEFIRKSIHNHAGHDLLIMGIEEEDVYQDLFLMLAQHPIPQNISDVRGFLDAAIVDRIRDLVIRQAEAKFQATIYADLCDVASPEKSIQRQIKYLSFMIPQGQREAIVGDILEDCCDRQDAGESKMKIHCYAIWHVLRAVFHLWPVIIVETIKRAFSTK